MWDAIIPAGAAWLPALALAAVVTALTSIVAAYRKLKTGEIEDDGALLTRAYDAAKKADELRQAAEKAKSEADDRYEKERRERWRVEDLAALYLRQLIENKITPAQAKKREEDNAE